MASNFTRRQFAAAAAAASLTTLLPRGVGGYATSAKKAVVHADQEIGIVRPEFHSHFAEHLGSCVYGGIWVGKKSPIPNINGFRKATVDYLKELGVPVLRWPGGCFADDYHWRDGIGPAEKRPKRVNIHWGNYIEDNSFGTHEFMEFCRLIGAEPYFAGQRRHRHAAGDARLDRVLQLSRRAARWPTSAPPTDRPSRSGSATGASATSCGAAAATFSPEQAAHGVSPLRDLRRAIRRNARSTWSAAAPTATMPAGPAASWTRWPATRMHGYSMHYYENGHPAARAVHAGGHVHAVQPLSAGGAGHHSAARAARQLRSQPARSA